jgi:hypothetical protein
MTIQGQTVCTGNGTVASPISCNDATNIDMHLAGTSNSILTITTAANKTFRLTGISINWGGGSTSEDHGALYITGNSTQVRVDHSHFNQIVHVGIQLDHIYGVLDHNLIDAQLNSGGTILNAVKFIDYQPDGNGDMAWSKPTSLGTANSIYMENNTFNGNNFGDCYWGGRYAVRFNTFNGSPLQTHPTIGSSRARGCRQWEKYLNTFTSTYCTGTACSNADFVSSGTGVIWGNTVSSAYGSFVTIHSDLSENNTYTAIPAPNGFGFCGKYWSGLVTTSGTSTVTSTSGNSLTQPFGFSVSAGNGTVTTSLAAGEPININGTVYTIVSFISSTQITVTPTPPTFVLPVPFYIPSNWSKNPNSVTGDACLDQPGRGQSDLLTGSFPNTIDSVTGTATWPNQKSEPIYEWLDTYAGPGAFWFNVTQTNFGLNIMSENRDYYLCSTPGTGACAAFTGATGVGAGPYSSIPSTCTPGTAFWATDQGSWNQSGSGGQGQLYICGSGGTFPAAGSPSYKPYAYPHPLTQGGPPPPPSPAPPTNLGASVI